MGRHRVQLVINDGDSSRIFSRTGDDVPRRLPDLADALGGHAVLDGELLVGHEFSPLAFNCLQQRLNRKTPAKSHLKDYPAFVRVYDMLFDSGEDLRDLPLSERRTRRDLDGDACPRLDLSGLLAFANWEVLATLRAEGAAIHGHEGLMIKQRSSLAARGQRPLVQMEARPAAD